MNASGHRLFKDLLFEQLARIARALANPHRLELVDLLAQGERNVEELARETAMSVASTSQHLQALRGARLVSVRRQGPYAFYALVDPGVFYLWQSIRDLGERRLAEIDRLVKTYLADRSLLEPVTAGELLERMRHGEVTVIDVRPAIEFAAGHVTDAHSVPISELEVRLQEIPREREVVAYCRGPFCVFADEAVAVLHAHGYKARRLDVGFPDWKAAGCPVSGS